MAEKLLIISDMWGAKKGLWITSYFGYLQQYYDISFYDSQQLACIDEPIHTKENIQKAFINGGINTAVADLLKKEINPSHVLAFGSGGTIAWKANLKGLPMKSLTILSATKLQSEEKSPKVDTNLIYGEYDQIKPDLMWANKLGVNLNIIPNFGHELYSDEKIICQVSMNLLEMVTSKAS